MKALKPRQQDVELAKEFLKGEFPNFADNQLFLELANDEFMDEIEQRWGGHYSYISRVIRQAKKESV